MGCAQGKPSKGSPARSDGLGIEGAMRNSGYVPSRRSDPLPTAPAAKEAHAAVRRESDKDRDRTEATTDDKETSTATVPPLPPQPPGPRREDELVDGWPTWLLDNVQREALQGIVPKSADAYDKIEKVGQGTYSNVYKARERGTGRIVALKKVRFDTSESESVRFMAREMRIVRRLDHPNVIRLDGIATSRMHRSIYLVFDFMYSDLTRVICRPDHRLTEPQIKRYMQQLLSGLQHCHERGILHRDIKGSNLLIDRDGVLKIGDFGLANYYDPNRRRPLTSRVVTLWYRAPELLLGSTDYGVGIDLWSAGCLLAEMFFGKPLMPGRTEVEQLFKIFSLCGSPPDDYWRKMKLPASFRPPKTYKSTMLERFRGLPPSSLSLLTTLLALDPAARGTARQALQSNFFSTPPLPCDLSSLPVVYKEEVADATAAHDGRKHKLRHRSQKRRDSKQKAGEEHADEPKLRSGSPNKVEEKVMDRANSGQDSDDAAVNASSRVQEPEDTIVNASSSTVSKRFSVSPVQVLPEGSPAPQDQQLRRANTYHSSSDDRKNHQPLVSLDDHKDSSIMNHGPEIRSASMSEHDAMRHDQEDLSNNKQYVFVDHI